MSPPWCFISVTKELTYKLGAEAGWPSKQAETINKLLVTLKLDFGSVL